jgi:uncharacterized protein
MILPDVNVLIYAFRRDSARHAEYRAWLQAVVDGAQRLRCLTAGAGRCGPHLYAPQDLPKGVPPHRDAAFCEALLKPAHSTLIQPGDRHWSIFTDLCESSDDRAIWSRTPGSRRWRSNTAASGSPPRTTADSAGFTGNGRSSKVPALLAGRSSFASSCFRGCVSHVALAGRTRSDPSC